MSRVASWCCGIDLEEFLAGCRPGKESLLCESGILKLPLSSEESREEPDDDGDLSAESRLLPVFEGRRFNSAVGVKELLELECERKNVAIEWGILYFGFGNAPLACEAVRLPGKARYDEDEVDGSLQLFS